MLITVDYLSFVIKVNSHTDTCSIRDILPIASNFTGRKKWTMSVNRAIV